MTTDELIKDFLHKHFKGKSLKEYLALKVILRKFYEYLKEKGELSVLDLESENMKHLAERLHIAFKTGEEGMRGLRKTLRKIGLKFEEDK